MANNLDPERIVGVLEFHWHASDEGIDWVQGLDRGLIHRKLNEWQKALIEAAVGETLSRIGIDKFRRHYEIRPILRYPELRLIELRWHLSNDGNPIHLRLYAGFRPARTLLVGLCFREKRLTPDPARTKKLQNQDIAGAALLALDFDQASA